MLLWPEKGMVLNPTATDIVQLCTGDLTVANIIDRLVEKYPNQGREAIARHVGEFVDAMADRGLMDGVR